MKKNLQFRPGPKQRKFRRIFSAVFAVIGVGFVCIGVTEVIPMAGTFGIIWTLIASLFTGIGIWGAIGKEDFYDYDLDINVKEEIQPENRTENRLKELQSLYDQHLITAEEYQQKREEILQKL